MWRLLESDRVFWGGTGLLDADMADVRIPSELPLIWGWPWGFWTCGLARPDLVSRVGGLKVSGLFGLDILVVVWRAVMEMPLSSKCHPFPDFLLYIFLYLL